MYNCAVGLEDDAYAGAAGYFIGFKEENQDLYLKMRLLHFPKGTLYLETVANVYKLIAEVLYRFSV